MATTNTTTGPQSTVSIRLPVNIISIVDELCMTQATTRKDVILAALNKYLLDDSSDSEAVTKAIIRQNHQVARALGRIDVLTESLLVFVATWFERHSPITDPSQQQQAQRNMNAGMVRFQNAIKADLTSNSKSAHLYDLLSDSIPELTAIHASEKDSTQGVEFVDDDQQ